MTLNQLLYFQKLAETSHMGKAAGELFISQPSLSTAIAKLEEELGVRLFARHGHHLSLTAEGTEFLLHTERILQETKEAKAHMQQLAKRQETHIRLGCIAPVLYGYLPDAINRFLSLPESRTVSFEFSVESNEELVRKLRNGLYDFVLCSVREKEGLEQFEILSEPLAIIAPKDRANLPATWEDLASESLIGCEEGSVIDRMLLEISRRRGLEFRFSYRATAEDAILSLVEHGFGLAILPWSEALMKKYAVTRQDLPDSVFSRNIYLTTVENRQPAGAAKRFIHYLLSQHPGSG